MRASLLFAVSALALSLCAPLAQADDAPPTPFIVIDQFGYLPEAPKVAVIRDPEIGFDSGWRFTPGAVYQVIDTKTQAVVFEGNPVPWKNGAVDPLSGDHAWSFDFSGVTAPGRYVIRDKQAAYDSYPFTIAPNVYKPVLVAAVRMLYYQRAGFAKEAKYAGANWTDKASHMRPGQDTEARLYSAKGDKSTERDLHGGWFDAGDLNRYTSWAGNDVLQILHAYNENPGAFTDDFNIPESGDGIPDLLDETKWEVDWMTRMQNPDGSLLSVLSAASGSPPSAATDRSYYGPATTGATYGGAEAFAYAAKTYAQFPQTSAYAAELKKRAIDAWTWAQAHPHVTFYNNDARDHSEGIAAGQQEVDDNGRASLALASAVYLFDLTGEATYRDYVDAHYKDAALFRWKSTRDYDYTNDTPVLYYASLPGATPDVAKAIRDAFADGWESDDGWGAVANQTDPYGAFMGVYGWGSNGVKSNHGNIFVDEALYGLGKHMPAEAMNVALNYVHYIDGVNPLGKVYLSNMGSYGATNSVDKFYHTWYAPGTDWDSASHSKFGPPPGYLVGGANNGYSWAQGCPGLSPQCGTAPPSPPIGQPAIKSYADFNDGWPIDSWEVTEPDIGYQAAYIQLLARFVK